MQKKLLKLRFLDYFPKAETEEYNQKDWSVSDKFWSIIPCSATYNREMGSPVSLKATTKAWLRGKKKLLKLRFSGYFSKAKTE